MNPFDQSLAGITRPLRGCLLALLIVSQSGCLAVSAAGAVVSTAVSVGSTVVGTAIDVGAAAGGAVKDALTDDD